MITVRYGRSKQVMKHPNAFATHLPILIKALSLTTGPVLEMGMGYGSSITMHWMCATTKRPITSFENTPAYFDFAQHFANDFHKVVCLDDWDKADIDQPWDVALLDHGPAERRIVDIRRLSNLVKYLVIHDTNGRDENHFHYKEIWPLFKWRYVYTVYTPHATVVSNLVDLSDFNVW